LGSWIAWAAGLVFFDILLIILVIGFGASADLYTDYTIPEGSYDSSVTSINSSSVVSWGTLNWFDKFIVTFSSLPWWLNLFTVVYNLVLVGLILLALVRGIT